ncbi:MAG: hypothetical protein KJ944_17395 [Alphaproteobacteria bacterium]|nr:hypothetical protein [Alphaproteobacteria bacterium]MBU1559633.1 hypothetical protein [Alphaproteobacteria bacterium]MBU2304368.1 hypothetical protein [Alphaproteobacteria bacterium]MBU2367153.1 hypothetical protein [Alphaproteobacteria bacterium]
MGDEVGAMDDTLASLGALVIYMQMSERLIGAVLRHVLPDSSAKTMDQLAGEITVYRKATLGALIKAVKQRIEIRDDFAEVLEAFLTDRNALIHDVTRITGFDLNTEQGRAVANSFLANLTENAEAVTKVFLALWVENMEETGRALGMDPELVEYLGDYGGIAGQVFFKRDD